MAVALRDAAKAISGQIKDGTLPTLSRQGVLGQMMASLTDAQQNAQLLEQAAETISQTVQSAIGQHTGIGSKDASLGDVADDEPAASTD